MFSFFVFAIVILLLSKVNGDKKPVLDVDSISFAPAANGNNSLTVVFSGADEGEMRKLFSGNAAKEGAKFSVPSIVVKDKVTGKKVVIRSRQQKNEQVNEAAREVGNEGKKELKNDWVNEAKKEMANDEKKANEVEKKLVNPMETPLLQEKKKRNAPRKQGEKSGSSSLSHGKTKSKSPSKKSKSSTDSGPLQPLTNGV
jgi:hypothetical protein